MNFGQYDLEYRYSNIYYKNVISLQIIATWKIIMQILITYFNPSKQHCCCLHTSSTCTGHDKKGQISSLLLVKTFLWWWKTLFLLPINSMKSFSDDDITISWLCRAWLWTLHKTWLKVSNLSSQDFSLTKSSSRHVHFLPLCRPGLQWDDEKKDLIETNKK